MTDVWRSLKLRLQFILSCLQLKKVRLNCTKLQHQENSLKASLGYALTSNQQFFRNSPVTPPVPGKITITGGVGAGLYNNLADAMAYIGQHTSSIPTDATLVGDVFKFTVPANNDFSGLSGFLSSVSANIQDPDGLITKFGDTAFQNNTGNNLLLNVEFGNDAFNAASGTNTITNILLSNSNDPFAKDYVGIMNILGNIGTTEGADYSNFFDNGGSATINAKVAKQTSNAGSPEGDLNTAVINLATVNYTL